MNKKNAVMIFLPALVILLFCTIFTSTVLARDQGSQDAGNCSGNACSDITNGHKYVSCPTATSCAHTFSQGIMWDRVPEGTHIPGGNGSQPVTIQGCQSGYAYVLRWIAGKPHQGYSTGQPAGAANVHDYYAGAQLKGSITWADATGYYANAWNASGQGLKTGANAMFNPSGQMNWFCDWEEDAEPPAPSAPPAGSISCEVLGGDANISYGNTTAESAVINMSTNVGINSDWHSTGTGIGGYNMVYARPGDSVMFRHGLCFGNRGVKEGYGSQDHYYENDPNYFRIRAEIPSRRYAFGLNDSLFNTDFYIADHSPTPSVVSAADVKGEYSFRVYSPSLSPDAGTKYGCDVGVYRLNLQVEPGYQIPGFTEYTGSCNAANEVGSTNDVGKTIRQQLEFNVIRSFITETTRVDQEWECHDHVNKPLISTTETRDEYRGGDLGRYGEPVEKGTCEVVNEYEYVWNAETEEYDEVYVGWHYEGTAPVWNYTGIRDNEDYPPYNATTVDVKIPYNFDTMVTSNLNAVPVFGGESVTAYFSWAVLPRQNIGINMFPYATITPGNSQVQVVEFTLGPGVSGPPGETIGSQSPCKYYGGNCNVIETISGPFNPTGSYDGDSQSKNYERAIPDVEAGTKYCVGIGIYPADSHDKPGTAILNQYDEGDNGMSGGSLWRIAGASCTPIAKKPNFQAWGAGIYTKGSINTAVTKKNVGVQLGGDPNPKRTFGSWSEFTIIPLGTVKGMASAAGLGYQASLQVTGGVSPSTRLCDVSNLTIVKPGCNDAAGGKSQISITSTIIDRFRSRYTSDEAPAKSNGYSVTQLVVDNPNEYNTIGSGVRYIKVNGDATIDKGVVRDENGNEIKRYNEITMWGGTDRNTLVIHATGTVTINVNICYGDSTCTDNSQSENYLRGGNARDGGTFFSAIEDLPQVLIFAENINIAANVSQVDAWLIATKKLNTCSDFVVGESTTHTCGTTLTINGPTYAGDLNVYRTAGALPGGGTNESSNPTEQNLANDGSITPAEIFNLRPDTYYWSYSQAQRYSQAVVTYQRELAPRY